MDLNLMILPKNIYIRTLVYECHPYICLSISFTYFLLRAQTLERLYSNPTDYQCLNLIDDFCRWLMDIDVFESWRATFIHGLTSPTPAASFDKLIIYDTYDDIYNGK